MQMEVIRTYTAKQPDELSLQVADVVLVSQTVEDGTSPLRASLAFIAQSCSLSTAQLFHLPVFNCVLSAFHHALLYAFHLLLSTYLSHLMGRVTCFEDVVLNLNENTHTGERSFPSG